MPDPLEHATGLEKYELLAKQAGNEDPFFLKAVKRAKGTKDSPTIVHAMDNYRMVGCLQRGGHQHQVDLAVRGRAQEVRVRLLDGAQDSPRPREVSPALVICLERILDHLCFILIIIVNKM